MDFRSYLKNNTVYLDGGMGTLLQKAGLSPKEKPEEWNLTHRDAVLAIHQAYFDAGSNVINTNTFGANLLHYEKEELDRVVGAALSIAKEAREKSKGKQEKFISLDIGPLGKLLAPFGDLDFEEAVAIFAETVKLGKKYGADLVTVETMSDTYETKAAVLAVREQCDLPLLVSCAFGADGKLLTGADPRAVVTMLEGLSVDAVGANCSLGPKQLCAVTEEILRYSSTPVLLKPNAGLPKSVGGKTVFDVGEEEFAREIAPLMEKGVRLVGGCCGTTPAYIERLVSYTKRLRPLPIEKKEGCAVSSYSHAVSFDGAPVLIGERINPTGKKAFKAALAANDIDYVLKEALAEEENGAAVLDVNVGLPEIDETALLPAVIKEIQAVVDLPLQIDTSSPAAMERAMRLYNGKPLINSVNGKEESMAAIFPLVKKYGGAVVCLTLDESGIPATADGRFAIAKKILKKAEEYGIDKRDLLFDTLAMTVSADNGAACVTLDAQKRIRTELGCHTVLGISNVSFGLPDRETVNAAFFTLALENGLSAGIVNPLSKPLMKAYYTFMLLKGKDENCVQYMQAAERMQNDGAPVRECRQEDTTDLTHAICKGMKEKAWKLTKDLLTEKAPLAVINEYVIPALNLVGEEYEQKKLFLPGLLMSAEAAKRSFDAVKEAFAGDSGEKKTPFVLATVEGDIHDIGKNIVKLLLENYGFAVVDLGKDVPCDKIVDEVVKTHCPLVGLSALMTTTVPAMEKTVASLKEKAPWCKIVVGGAVLTEEYAEKIGAHAYAKDAMQTVRFAQKMQAK